MFDRQLSRMAGPPSSVMADYVAVEVAKRQLEYREYVTLLALDDSGDCLVREGLSTRSWVASTFGVRPGVVSKRLKVSRWVCSQPVLVEAFAAGLVGWAHLEVLYRAENPRITGVFAAMFPELVGAAESMLFERWADEVRGVAYALDADGGYDPAEDDTNNSLQLSRLANGFTMLHGELNGLTAFVVGAILDAETEAVRARWRRDLALMFDPADPDLEAKITAEMPAPGFLRAQALQQLLERGALVADADGNLLKPDLTIVTEPISADGAEQDEVKLSGRDGVPVASSLLGWAILNGTIRLLEMSDSGDPLRLGRKYRYATREQRLALALRDGGCIFPGCTAPPSRCDAHHITEWDDDGPTDVENMGLLCRFHHRLTHQQNWKLQHAPPGLIDLNTPERPPDQQVRPTRLQWSTPTGTLIEAQRHQTRRAA